MQLQQGQGLTLAGGYGARRDVQGLGGLRQGEALEVAQHHHRPQLTGQAGDGLPQGSASKASAAVSGSSATASSRFRRRSSALQALMRMRVIQVAKYSG